MLMRTTETPEPIIPALRKVYAPLAPYAYTFIRVCVGLIIARHGYPKLFEGGVTGLAGLLPKLGLGPSLAWAYLIGVVEFAGGVMLALGLLTRFASLALVIEFTVIVFVVKFANGFLAFAPRAIKPGFPGMVHGGFEFELLLGLSCLAFLFGGAGRLSLDQVIGKEV
jgi:putative oxidoreductase